MPIKYIHKIYLNIKIQHGLIGGRILLEGPPLCDEIIYTKGVWIPSINDLLSWLEENHCKFTISFTGTGYKVNVTDSHGVAFTSKGTTPEFALFNVIKKILMKYGGNLGSKEYIVVEAEFIDRKDL